MLDLVLLGVKLAGTQQVVDLELAQREIYKTLQATYDLIVHLQILPLHVILPSSILQLTRYTENHLDGTRYYSNV